MLSMSGFRRPRIINTAYMEDFSEQQQSFMRRAIEVGERGRCSSPPNPWVGCLIVKKGKVIGEGFHAKQGLPHAEENAILSATESVAGADVYVTLEPCCHYAHTPPCVELLIKHRVGAVYIALLDPDPRVSHKGVDLLRQAGIPVFIGLEQEQARRSLRPYLQHRMFGLPWIVLKSAATLDGQVADRRGESQWITCPEARADVGVLRQQSQAILVGSKTVLLDNPRLTARTKEGDLYPQQPLRVVLDSRGAVPTSARIFQHPETALYVTTELCPEEHTQQLSEMGVTIFKTAYTASGVDLEKLFFYLASLGVLQVLVEGGRTLLTACFPYAHAWELYLGNKILGDQNQPLLRDLGLLLPSAREARIFSVIKLGESIKISLEL